MHKFTNASNMETTSNMEPYIIEGKDTNFVLFMDWCYHKDPLRFPLFFVLFPVALLIAMYDLWEMRDEITIGETYALVGIVFAMTLLVEALLRM